MIRYRYIFYFVLFGINYNFYGMEKTPVKERFSAVDQQGSITKACVYSPDWGSPILRRGRSVLDFPQSLDSSSMDRSFAISPWKSTSTSILSQDFESGLLISESSLASYSQSTDDESGRTDRLDSLSSNTSMVELDNKQKQNDIRQMQVFKCLQSPSAVLFDERMMQALSCFKHINRTQRKTKQKVSGVIVDVAFSKIRSEASEEDYQDKAIVDLLENEHSVLGSVLKTVSNHLSSAKKRKLSVVDINHIKKPTIDNKRGKEVLQGGHDLSKYEETDFLEADINAFVDRNGVIATMIDGVHPKTALPKIIPSEIIDVSRNGYMIAQSSAKKMKKCLLKNEEGMYFEGFLEIGKVFLYKTIYPVLTIDLDSIDDHGNIKIGGFGKIRSDKSGVDIVSHTIISKAQLDQCIAEGRPFGLGDSKRKSQSEYDVTDITEPLSKHCATELLQMSTEKMPGTVYAITRKMSGAADGATDV